MGRNRKRRRRKKSPLAALIIIVLLLIAAVFFGANAYINGLDEAKEPNSEISIAVTVPSGASTTHIGQLLEESQIIDNARDFKLYSKVKKYDGRLKAGDYMLSPSMTLSEIFEILESGNVLTKTFTIPEGLTIAKTAERLSELNLINKEEFLRLVGNGEFDYEFMSLLPAGDNRLEGFLFPETYEVFANASETDIINKMLGQFDKVFKEEYYKRAEELKVTPYEIITIASLIEAETRVDEERGKVASVIYNRLESDMLLGIDATVLYAIGGHKEVLTKSDLEVDSPYNTRKYPGLPPGPICSPGEASIKAALYPDDTNYYYYVLKSKDEISHNFAVDYEEFLRYKRQYQESL